MNKYLEAFKRLCKHTEQLQVFQLIDNDPAFPFNKIAYEEDKKTIKELVDKATPNKPSYEADGYDENGELIYDTWICPNCDKKYEVDYDEYDHCPNCGQAIDWSDEEWK